MFGKENEVIEKLQEVAVLKFKMDDNDLSVEIENNKLLASNTSEEIVSY